MTDALRIRVRVLEAWDDIIISLPPSTPISEVKRRALEVAHIPDDPAEFLMKFRGAELADESQSLGQHQVPPDAALIVMRRRRLAVR